MATATPTTTEYAARHNPGVLRELPLECILPSPHNPRKAFGEEDLADLAASIAEMGVMVPIVVRAIDAESYEVIAGERRWRAAHKAKLPTIPALVRAADDQEAGLLRVVENLQRVDVRPTELARGFEALHADFGLSEPEIARRTGRSQPQINKYRMLCRLPGPVLALLDDGSLSAAHAIALLKYKEFPDLCAALATLAVDRRWTSKHLESQTLLDDYSIAGNRQLLRRVDGHAGFDIAQCTACPYGAFRTSGGYGGHCLRPAHFDQLAEETAAAKRQQMLAAAAQATTETKASVPLTSDLKYDEYRSLISYQAPDGCTADCPCRGVAIGYNGKPEPVCTDVARFDKLAASAKRATAKVKRAAATALIGEIERHVRGLQEMGPVETALLLYPVFASVKEDARVAACKAQLHEAIIHGQADLAQLTPHRQMQLVLDALLRGELLLSLQDDWRGTSNGNFYAEHGGVRLEGADGIYHADCPECHVRKLRRELHPVADGRLLCGRCAREAQRATTATSGPCTHCGVIMELTAEDLADPASAICGECA